MQRKKPSYNRIRTSEEINIFASFLLFYLVNSEKESYAILSATAENCFENTGILPMDVSYKLLSKQDRPNYLTVYVSTHIYVNE